MKNSIQSVLLLITVLMPTTGADEVIYAQVGETITLKPLQPLKSYAYWYFDRVDGLQLAWRNALGGQSVSPDDAWKERLSLSDFSLVIKSIQQENFGTFIFQQLGESTSTRYKVLKVEVTNQPSPLLPGDRLTLACNAEPPPNRRMAEIHWLNPQGEKMKPNSVTITATSQHNGKWFCVVTHDNKEKKAEVSVTVLGLSPVRPQYTSTSWPLTVPCSLASHITWEQLKTKDIKEVHWNLVPKPGSSPQRLFSLSLEDPLTWKPEKYKDLSPVSDPKKRNLSLTKHRGREEDRGDYTCALEFKNGVTLNTTVHVDVLQITSSPGTELISGQQLNLTCSLGSPLTSDLSLKWLPPKQSSLYSSLPSDPHPARLTIPEVGTGDSGKWRCELWQNKTRLTSAEITLKIEPKLSVSMLVVICSVAVIVILLIVLAVILCRRRQRKTRHLRHRMCQCKTPKPKGFYRT